LANQDGGITLHRRRQPVAISAPGDPPHFVAQRVLPSWAPVAAGPIATRPPTESTAGSSICPDGSFCTLLIWLNYQMPRHCFTTLVNATTHCIRLPKKSIRMQSLDLPCPWREKATAKNIVKKCSELCLVARNTHSWLKSRLQR